VLPLPFNKIAGLAEGRCWVILCDLRTAIVQVSVLLCGWLSAVWLWQAGGMGSVLVCGCASGSSVW
jgi:hypothetical protein